MLKREARKPPPRQRVPEESAKPAVPEEVSVPPPSMSQMAVCGDPPKDPGLVPPRCGCHMEECICHLVNHLTDRTEYKYRPNDGSSLDSNAGSDRVPRLPEVPLTQTRPTEDCPGLVPMAIATPVDNRSDSETSGGSLPGCDGSEIRSGGGEDEIDALPADGSCGINYAAYYQSSKRSEPDFGDRHTRKVFKAGARVCAAGRMDNRLKNLLQAMKGLSTIQTSYTGRLKQAMGFARAHPGRNSMNYDEWAFYKGEYEMAIRGRAAVGHLELGLIEEFELLAHIGGRYQARSTGGVVGEQLIELSEEIEAQDNRNSNTAVPGDANGSATMVSPDGNRNGRGSVDV